MMEKLTVLLLIFAVLLRIGVAEVDEPVVTSVSPRTGGIGGGFKLTVFGQNFAKDQYGQNNEVVLKSLDDERTFPCEPFKQDSDTEQLVCYPVSGMVRDTTYYPQVKVGGQKVKDSNLCGGYPYKKECGFTPKWWFTPTIKTLTPYTGPAGDVKLTAYGRSITERYGSNMDISRNGIEKKMIRFYSPGTCELKDGDNLYEPFGLVDEDSYDGFLTCKHTDTFIGCANASYLIEAPYGRSVPDMKLYRIASNGDLCMVQYYAVVDSVEPAMGSTEGEVLAKLAIPFVEQGVEQKGDGSTYAPIRVTIADMDCPVINVVKNEYLECKVPKKPETMKATYAGCRGVDVEYWTEQPTNDLDALKAAAPSGDVKHLDITHYCTREFGAVETGAAYTRMTGRFIPPKSGSYRFDVKAGGKAKVFLDNNEQAHSTGSWSYGPRTNLDDQQSYQLLVVGYNPIGDPADETDNPCVEVRANFFSDVRHTSASTGNAYDEVQKIKVTSETVPEKQRIGFSGFTQNSGSVIHEVQKVSIQGSSFDIKLEMFNTWTEEVSIDDPVEVKTALNKYPWLKEGVDSFDVTSIDETSVRITFNSLRGDIPPFIVHGSEDITATVREDTKGQSDNDFISLSVGGIPSQPFMASSMDASTLLEAANSLFEAKCPAAFTTGKKFEDFEGESNDYVYGELVRDVEPFSGRKSIRNPKKIYPAKTGQGDIRMLGWSDFYACFAYSGLRNPVFKYTYKRKNDEENPITKSIPVHPLQEQSHWRDLTRRFPRTPVSWQIWSYACVHPNYTELQGNSIVELKLAGEDDGEFLVDAVLLTEEQPFKGNNLRLAEQRKRPASPNSEYMVLIDEVVVDPIDGTPDEYDVTLHPFNCGNDFGLMELTNKEGSAGTLHVSRELTASEPIEGKVKVAFEGQESAEFNMALEADTIADILRTSIPKIGTVSVKFSEQSTCSDIEVLVTFESKPGDQELMTLVSQEWTSVPTPEAIIESHVDGHIRFDPILGDMISVERDKPQFRVFINDMLSHCPGDATFEWSELATPTVESVDPNEGAAGDSVVITGTKFSATPEDNEVRIGDIVCDVTASTETTISCTVGPGGGSALEVQVVVSGKGRAAGTAATFSYAWEVGTTEPATISCGGGKVMTINGKGFTKGFMARFGENECVIKEIQPNMILCIAPKSPSGCDGSTLVTVTVVQPSRRRRRNIGAGTKTSTTQVQYLGSETGFIISFDAPAELSVQGGEPITVTGENLGNNIEEAVTLKFDDGSDMRVDLSSVDVVVNVVTATFFMPSGLRPGVVRFGIDMAGTGYAVDQTSGELPSRSITLYADSISPQSGSVHGGFLLTLSGKGFGTDMDEVEVEIESHSCQIESLNNEEIVCQVERTAHKETISNLGTTGPFGVYYTSSKPYTEIEVGDCITFTWETPEFVLEVKHGMYETKSLDSTELVPNGISSGAKTLSGAYEVCYNQAKNHSMWSGYVDQNEIRNYRTLVVVREKEAWTNAEITVTVNSQQAQYNPPAGAKKRRKREACQYVTTTVRGCSYEDPQTVPDGMYVSFSRCHTPIVDGITFKNAHTSLDRSVTTATEITVRGTGFTQDSCAITAIIGKGDDSCECSVLTPTSETQFKCQPASECASTIGVFRELSVWIGNRGYANMDLTMYERSMAFIPLITGIEPDSGSAAGGTPFTITGSGLQFMTSVTVNDYEAECTVISDSRIDCTSPRTSNGDVVVHVRNFESVCETGALCVFRYTNTKTPSVTGIEPNIVDKSADTVLTITGKRLGDNAAEITVSFAGETCRDVTVVDPETEITCTVNGVPAGEHEIDLTVRALGKASSSSTATLTGEPVIEELSPNTGSIHGGTLLTLVGTGFHKDATTVTIDGEICDIEELTVTRIVCVSPDHAAGAVDLQVVAADDIAFDPQTFTYSTDVTPSVTSESVTPTSGVAGESITIPGDEFGDDPSKVTVDIGGADCEVDTYSNSEIVCTLGSHSSEMVTGRVLVEGKGLSNEFAFTYQAELDSVSPSTANYKGGQLLTLIGKGFSEETTATVCDEACMVEDWTVTQIFCVVPPGEDEQACDVTVSEGGLDKTLPDALTYDSAPTAEISLVDPNRGGTGGGNLISITGSGFGNDASAVSVIFAGSECEDVTLVSDTEITCVTSNHTGSVKTHAIVSIGGVRAVETSVGASEFWYIDLWSSTSTWGGNPVPEDGEMIVIKKGTIILLDIDTNVLGGLLIGGELVFDKTQERLELQSHFILVYDGGKLQIGTEEEPYENKAIITLHGHARSPEVPVYGNKVLALMEGRLELHGKDIPTPWTQLTQTAVAGSDQIRIPVGHSINWAEQDEVVIATTGGHLSQHESEMRTITDIEIQGVEAVLTLDSALEYTHSGVTEIHGDRTLEVRAEVGLLTRTVVVRGSNNQGWDDKIEKCADGFNPGEFAVQTCFQGRFGEGLGTDQFGATIMVHQKNQEKDSEIAQAHIEYIEVTHAGQAFRLGRYPIHFHLNGEMPNSYIRGCAVHHTFNRAINIHGVYNTLIEFNVVYNIMGGAIFLEDGIETGNNFQYNLAVFVISSSSLQNDDITPAAFWITNPNNTVRHNHAVGGTHFGFWYRMNERPDGPSYDPNYCPRNIPLGIFYNNTAHSLGWFGVWLFQFYFPMEDGACGTSVERAKPAKFYEVFVYNSDKGFEGVDMGALQLINSIIAQCKSSGYEGVLLVETEERSEKSALVQDTLILGEFDTEELKIDYHGKTNNAIVAPFGRGFRLENVKIKNCDNGIHFAIKGLCKDRCGGFTMQSENVTIEGDTPSMKYRWEHESVIEDLDDSLCGGTGESRKVIPKREGDSFPPDCILCAKADNSGVQAYSCPSHYKFHRLAFNDIYPEQLAGKSVRATNEYGSSTADFMGKRLTHPPGWMIILVGGQITKLEFVNAENMVNLTFAGEIYNFVAGDYVVLQVKVLEEPTMFSLDFNGNLLQLSYDESTPMADGPLDIDTVKNGDWYYDADTSLLSFAVVAAADESRRKRDLSASSSKPIKPNAIKCHFPKCITPPPRDEMIPASQRPDDFVYYDQDDLWKVDPDNPEHVIANSSVAEGSVTTSDIHNGYDITILQDEWVVVRFNHLITSSGSSSPSLGKVFLYGGLEISDWPEDSDDVKGATSTEYNLELEMIFIIGGRLVIGWHDRDFEGQFTLSLTGDPDNEYYVNEDWETGIPVPSNSLAVYGGLDVFGKNYSLVWTTLTATVNAGEDTVYVANDVSAWPVGGEVLVTTTGYRPDESEKLTIAAVTANSITFTGGVNYRHIGSSLEVDGTTYGFSAAVALLTRNVKFTSRPWTNGGADAGTVRVSVMLDENGDINTGYARVHYAEFVGLGSDGFSTKSDPRFGLSYVNTGNKRDSKPSSLYHNSFHDLYNAGFGAFGTSGYEMFDNVVYKSVGQSVVIDSTNTAVQYNLGSNMQWTGAYNGRSEENNLRYEAIFDISEATNTLFEGNYAVGSERSGFRLPGDSCDEASRHAYSEATANIAAVNQMGITFFFDYEINQPDNCVMISGFKLWKNVDYGILYIKDYSPIFSDIVFADNQVDLFAMVYGDDPLSHQCTPKTVKVEKSVSIGRTPSMDCTEARPSGTAFELSGNCRGRTAGDGGKLGLLFGMFPGGHNKAPQKPCANVITPNAPCGHMTVSDTIFSHYGSHGDTSCPPSYAIATNPNDDDHQGPMFVTTTKTDNVEAGYEFWINRPNIGKIKISDCVDMDCDAFKKVLFQDNDGDFLGSPGSVISQSEWEWGGDPRRGLGDYRIPTVMQTRLDGSRIPFDEIYDETGIARPDGCTLEGHKYNPSDPNSKDFAYYKCPNTFYHQLAIESMDEDKLSRRLSPVAVRARNANGKKFIDLINGPQDHGCCSGYLCLKRLSTFMAILPDGTQADIYLTSTTPDRLKFSFVAPAPTACNLLVIYYSKPNRIDLYVDGVFKLPTNGGYDKFGKYKLVNEKPKEEYIPSCATSENGDNYIDRENKEVYLVLKGNSKAVLQRSVQIMVSIFLPAMTPEEFFGEKLIENLAAILNIPQDRVRIVDVVSANEGRRKRATGTEVTAEIGPEPTQVADDANTDEDQTPVLESVVNLCQSDKIGEAVMSEGASCGPVETPEGTYTNIVPATLQFYQQMVPQHEKAVFATQPKLRAHDSEGNVITQLGIESNPWQMEAKIRSGTGHPQAVLGGTTTVVSDNGWFNFTGMFISHAATGYYIDFDIIMPSTAVDLNLKVSYGPFEVAAVPMKARLFAMTSGDIIQNSPISLSLELHDETTGQIIQDITWREHSFSAYCGLPNYNEISNISGTQTQPFAASTGRVEFDDLVLTGYGPIFLECLVESTPAEFSIPFYQKVFVLSSTTQGGSREKTDEISIRFLDDFATTVPTDAKKAELEQRVLQKITTDFPNIVIVGSTIEEGSIVITFTVEGSTDSVTLMQQDLCTAISEGQSYTLGSTTLTLDGYMTVDGQPYYGVSCAAEAKGEGLHPGFIALIAVLDVLLIVIVVLLLLWKFKVAPKTKTHDNGKTVYLRGGILHEGTFNSLKSEAVAPSTTLYSSHGGTDLRSSPVPMFPPLHSEATILTLSAIESNTAGTSTPAPVIQVEHPKPKKIKSDGKLWKY